MKRKLIFLQIILCMILFLFCMTMRMTSHDKAVAVGTFGTSKARNLTFEDYIYNKYGDLF